MILWLTLSFLLLLFILTCIYILHSLFFTHAITDLPSLNLNLGVRLRYKFKYQSRIPSYVPNCVILQRQLEAVKSYLLMNIVLLSEEKNLI